MLSDKVTLTLLFASALTLASCGGTSSSSTPSSSTEPTSSTSNLTSDSSLSPSSCENAGREIRIWYPITDPKSAQNRLEALNEYCNTSGQDDLLFVMAESFEESDLILTSYSQPNMEKEAIPAEYFGDNLDGYIQAVKDFYEFRGTIDFIPLEIMNLRLFYAKKGHVEQTKGASIETLLSLVKEKGEMFGIGDTVFLNSLICDGLLPLSKIRESNDFSFLLDSDLKPAWEKLYRLYHDNMDILADKDVAGDSASIEINSFGTIVSTSSANWLVNKVETYETESANPYSVYTCPQFFDGDQYKNYVCGYLFGYAFPKQNNLDAELKRQLVELFSSTTYQKSFMAENEWFTPVSKSFFENPTNPITQIVKDSGKEIVAYESLFKDPFYGPSKVFNVQYLLQRNSMDEFYQTLTEYVQSL